jgi:hypothetical protein
MCRAAPALVARSTITVDTATLIKLLREYDEALQAEADLIAAQAGTDAARLKDERASADARVARLREAVSCGQEHAEQLDLKLTKVRRFALASWPLGCPASSPQS